MSRLRALKQSLRGSQERELALRRQAQMLDLAPVLVRDPQDTIIYWNHGIELLYGFTKEEALGRHSRELLQTQFPEPPERILGPLRSGTEWHGELAQRRRDGTSIFVHSVWQPQLDETGDLTAIIEADSDITERKRAEFDRARLAAIVESSEDAIISKSLDGIIATWNAGAERLLGYRAEEVIGRPITIIIPPDLRAEEAVILGRLRRGERIEHYETVRLAKDGHRIELSLTISPVRDTAGHIIGASKIAHDITRRKRAERALQAAMDELARAKNELEVRVEHRTARLRETVNDLETFSYTISHDLRSSLRAIQCDSQIALEEGEGKLDPSLVELLRRIVSAGNRMDRLIQDVLALSRASRQDIRLGPVDLDRLARQIVQDQPELQPPRAEITVESPLLPVLGHELSLCQCLTNLLSNAVKYVAPGVKPRVRIYTEPRPDRVRLWVADNGIGIPAQAQHRIFEIFQRLHRSDQYEGTGIGLAIVRKAVARMSGQVGVESELGTGSRFWIELPKPNAPSPQPRPSPPGPP